MVYGGAHGCAVADSLGLLMSHTRRGDRLRAGALQAMRYLSRGRARKSCATAGSRGGRSLLITVAVGCVRGRHRQGGGRRSGGPAGISWARLCLGVASGDLGVGEVE